LFLSKPSILTSIERLWTPTSEVTGEVFKVMLLALFISLKEVVVILSPVA
jgi:hypothetical protein